MREFRFVYHILQVKILPNLLFFLLCAVISAVTVTEPVLLSEFITKAENYQLKRTDELLYLLILVFLLRTVLVYAKNWLILKDRYHCMEKISCEAMRHVLLAKGEAYTKHTASYLASRVLDEVFNLEGIFPFKIIDGLANAAMCALFFGWLAAYSVWAALLTVAFLAADYYFAMKLPLRKVYREHNEARARLESDAVNMIEGHSLIKLGNHYARELGLYHEKWRNYAGKLGKRDRMRELQVTSGSVWKNFGNIVMIGICAVLLSAGKLDLAAFLVLLNIYQYIWAFAAVAETLIPQYQIAAGACDRIAELFDVETEEAFAGTEQTERFSRIETIRMEHISFSYGNRSVLRDCSVSAKRGEITTVTGKSGCGKSTLFRVLMGMEQGFGGEIYFDGGKMDAGRLVRRRAAIGFVEQETFLFHRTLRENLVYHAKTEISDEVLWEILEKFDLAGRVRTFEAGLDTVVGGNVEIFSGGEKQRIGIIRELLKKPQILLLDECTSNLDTANEAIIYDALRRIKDDVLIVQIAHKARALASSDAIYLLEDGTAKLQPASV